MALKINTIDIGARIRREVEAQHWTYTEFAKAINCSRSALYNIFNSSDITIQRLLQISRVLNIDFLSEIYSFECDDTPQRPGTVPFLSIPLTSVSFDVSKIPYPLLEMLKSEIDSDPRMMSDEDKSV
jgi:DNA-binding helix-turn-helix protein